MLIYMYKNITFSIYFYILIGILLKLFIFIWYSFSMFWRLCSLCFYITKKPIIQQFIAIFYCLILMWYLLKFDLKEAKIQYSEFVSNYLSNVIAYSCVMIYFT